MKLLVTFTTGSQSAQRKHRAIAITVLVLLAQEFSLGQVAARDAYVRYELLAPSSGALKVVADVTLASAGSATYLEALDKGIEATEVSALDLMTGTPLTATQASGAIRVALPRPVVSGGESRIQIARMEKDSTGYRRTADGIVFSRTLAARRGSVTLPPGHELTGASVPVQVLELPDGRIVASFMNPYPIGAPTVIRARPLKVKPASVVAAAPPAAASSATPPVADAPPREQPMNQIRVTERALQDREIVYFLKEPETHAFALYHDYTAAREGERQYVNVVRAGSSVSEPSAKILDTGETLQTRTLTGADIAREKIDIPDRVDADTQVVLIAFPPVKKGTSVRLRISETYTDPARYALIDGQLMWHRSFGRSRNDMVLPAGWYLTTSSTPALVSQEPDGRTRLSFWNARPDSLDVVVRGRRR